MTGALKTTRACGRRTPPLFAAVDLGTNNCRLLIATPTAAGFRVVDSFSRIVRLGEGLSATGELQPAAIERTIEALQVCAERIGRRGATRVRAVATQSCRGAANRDVFVRRVRDATGLRLEVITPEEEARLAVAGCLDLLVPHKPAALVLDVGGGSTEVSWLDLKPSASRLAAWRSLPLGVVVLAERFPEQAGEACESYQAMLGHVREVFAAIGDPAEMSPRFQAGEGQVIGVSGAVTSLAALQMRLARYRRDVVDGAWISAADCAAVTDRLLRMSLEERAAEPCIGPERADLVLAGAAILHGVLERWPAESVRVGDRGLREGLLLEMMAKVASDRAAERQLDGRAA